MLEHVLFLQHARVRQSFNPAAFEVEFRFVLNINNWVLVSNYFSNFTPIWGRFPFWRIFFQMGWNHQPEKDQSSSFFQSDLVIIRPSSHLLYHWGLVSLALLQRCSEPLGLTRRMGRLLLIPGGRMGRLYRKWRFTNLKSVSNVYSCSMWGSTKIIYTSHPVIYCVPWLCDFCFAWSKHIKATAAQHVPRCRDVWRFGAPRRGPIFAGWRVTKKKICNGWCLILKKNGRFQGIMFFFIPSLLNCIYANMSCNRRNTIHDIQLYYIRIYNYTSSIHRWNIWHHPFSPSGTPRPDKDQGHLWHLQNPGQHVEWPCGL